MKKQKKTSRFEKVDLEKESISRRNFIKGSLKVLTGLAVVELGGVGLLYMRARSLAGEFGGMMTVGAVEEFIPGSVVEYEEGNFFLIRDDTGGFMAVYRRCPHLGCTVKYLNNEEKFLCPCHSASFDLHGDFESKMVTRALDIFPVSFDKGMVRVDTSQPIMREHHSPEDLSYPA